MHYIIFYINKKNKNQYEEKNEANELNNQTNVFQQGENGYIFDSILKLPIKLFRYHNIIASSYCNLPNPFCYSKSTIKAQNDKN